MSSSFLVSEAFSDYNLEYDDLFSDDFDDDSGDSNFDVCSTSSMSFYLKWHLITFSSEDHNTSIQQKRRRKMKRDLESGDSQGMLNAFIAYQFPLFL